jgi:hypothetical protein
MVHSLIGHARLDTTTSRCLHAEADQLHVQVTQTLVTPASCAVDNKTQASREQVPAGIEAGISAAIER